MRGSLRMLVAAGAAAAFAALPAAAGAAPASTTFHVVGTETAFTSTQGTFVGTAFGNAADTGAWKAVVDHTTLVSLPATITGGTFKMTTVGPGPTNDFVQAAFTNGGTIDVGNPGLGCKNQTFEISGDLDSVTTSTTSGGTGHFEVVLTHYRFLLFGRCVTYAASVTGTAGFTY